MQRKPPYTQFVSAGIFPKQEAVGPNYPAATLPKPKRQHRLVATADISAGRFSWLSCPADVVATQVAGLALQHSRNSRTTGLSR